MIDRKKDFYNSFGAFCIVSLLIFGIMWIFNSLMPYIADDYVYMFGFHDKKPITDGGFSRIFDSIYAHSFKMNGRAISHGLEQVFMFFPKALFNLINSFVYLFLVYIVYRIINCREKRNWILYLSVAAALWQYTPAFGQVYIWQVGSLNYLWSMLGMVLFLSPFIYRFMHHRDLIRRNWQRVIFWALSVVMGMYHEIPSFIMIVIAVILVVLIAVMKKEKKIGWLVTAVAAAAIGYVLLLLMPVEMSAKQSKMELSVLLSNFMRITRLLRANILPLMIVWAVMFPLGCLAKAAKERLILSGIFAGGAVAASYMMIIARYIPERCLLTTTVLAVLAIGIIIPPLLKTPKNAVPICYGVILAVVCAFSFVEGSVDIINSKLQVDERELYIEEMKQAGEGDITLSTIKPETRYSPFYGLIDLQIDRSDMWPNRHMAHYYGLGSITGVE